MTPENSNTSLDSDSPSERKRKIRGADARCTRALLSHHVYNLFPDKPAVRACYLSLLALKAEHINDPRLSELSLISGYSEVSISRATSWLEAAGLITKERVRGVGRPIVYCVIAPEDASFSCPTLTAK